MCLFTKQICPKKATHDVECYKIVHVYEDVILSPIISASLKFNEILDAEFCEDKIKKSLLPGSKELCINSINTKRICINQDN